MLSLFSVGVQISLVDKVSSALGVISRHLMSTQVAANVLNARLNSIGKLWAGGLMVTAGGLALSAPVVAAIKTSETYISQLNRMKMAGMSQAEVADAVAQAWATSGKVITSTATENLKIVSDLRSVFGDVNEAISYAPTFAKMQGAYAGILEGRLSQSAEAQSFAAAKALDMIGLVKDAVQFNAGVAQMFKVTETTAGRVLPQDYMTAYKYMRQAKYGLSDEFRYKVLPELILENKGGGGSGMTGGVGPQIAALYRFGIQGIMNRRSAAALQNLGMIPESSILKTTTTGTTLKGGVLGADILSQNPLEWVQKVFLPHLATKMHIATTDTNKLIGASNQVFKGNQLAASLVAELIKKPFQYERFGRLYEKSMPMDQAYQQSMKASPEANWKALSASLNNLQTAIGMNVVPVIIPAVNSVSTAIQKAAGYMKDHPKISMGIVGVSAALSGLMIAGGVGMMLKAAAMGLGLVLTPVGLLVRTIPVAAGGLIGLAGAMGPVGWTILGVTAATAGLIYAFTHWKQISAALRPHIDSIKTGFGVLVTLFPPLKLTLQGISWTMAHWTDVCKLATNAWNGLINAVQGAVNWINMVNAKWTALQKYPPGQEPPHYKPIALDLRSTGNAIGNFFRGQFEQTGMGKSLDLALGIPGRNLKTALAAAGVSNFNTTINVTQMPGESGEHLADRVVKKIAEGAVHKARSAPSPGGLHLSRYSHGGPDPH